MKFLFGFVFYMFSITLLYGQKPALKYAIGLEVLGSSDIYSLNVSRFLSRNNTFQTGISWLPGTWQMGGNNDRSFLYIPFLMGHQFSSNKLFLLVQAGAINKFILHKGSHDNLEMRIQFGGKIGYIIGDNLQFGLGLYYKTPFFLSVSRVESFVYNSKSSFFWPSISVDYKF